MYNFVFKRRKKIHIEILPLKRWKKKIQINEKCTEIFDGEFHKQFLFAPKVKNPS